MCWLFARRQWIASEIVGLGPTFGGGPLAGFRMAQTRLVLRFQDGRRLQLSQWWLDTSLPDLERAMRGQWDLEKAPSAAVTV